MPGSPRNGANDRAGRTRTRTFTGCWTCRARHVKCDETHPTCMRCKTVKIDCEGYEVTPQWESSRTLKTSGNAADKTQSQRTPMIQMEDKHFLKHRSCSRHSLGYKIHSFFMTHVTRDAEILLDQALPLRVQLSRGLGFETVQNSSRRRDASPAL